jgi:lipoyl(octanoyl) transferase
MNKTIQLHDLGTKDYKETWEYQEELFKGIVDLKFEIAEKILNYQHLIFFCGASTCIYLREKWWFK